MYAAADDEVTYEFYTDPSGAIKNYADYLRLHEAAKATAYKRFRYFYNNLVKGLFYRMLPISLAPAILFWSNWYYYVLGLGFGILGLALYKYFFKGGKIGFYQRLIVYAVLSNYLNDKKLKKLNY
jgi:hypothetical protein